ncbi:YecR family lipoprotein [Morganella morganii subsp. sibonii]|uniref:YecR family lipoprotein n=1 Tax=Morganella morganii TaxID=582 RepID=UPI00235F6DC3|nr:YecR family lipoprotein [Morganella morganii]EGT3623050.1 hypothetical protein [Morganella morganii]EGT3632272.1 hypothetical protein [Morganella morganii]EGT3636368.1 hypothetical protein [Morganella morganii]EKK5571350.1 hypothetical protein [Morganella morganii]EKU5842409.1 hypothetical protein [Morganella morganii]
MNKIFIATLCSLLISGCTVKKEMTPIGGSKADGTVRMGYTVGSFETPLIDMQQASDLAAKKCSVWGYTGAEAFGGKTSRCTQADGWGGCNMTEVSVEFQCIGGKASDN